METSPIPQPGVDVLNVLKGLEAKEELYSGVGEALLDMLECVITRDDVKNLESSFDESSLRCLDLFRAWENVEEESHGVVGMLLSQPHGPHISEAEQLDLISEWKDLPELARKKKKELKEFVNRVKFTRTVFQKERLRCQWLHPLVRDKCGMIEKPYDGLFEVLEAIRIGIRIPPREFDQLMSTYSGPHAESVRQVVEIMRRWNAQWVDGATDFNSCLVLVHPVFDSVHIELELSGETYSIGDTWSSPMILSRSSIWGANMKDRDNPKTRYLRRLILGIPGQDGMEQRDLLLDFAALLAADVQ